ncbi:MAG: Radical SAM superfamily protein [Lentisphaerae bacterium ADurb.BinA184]|nr:MAG: Radical SAM superfamily protein [Lentisphaerae bacterium ADurb.BinA184]
MSWDAAYRNCHLCPRRCGVDRTRGQRGVCGQTDACRVASVGPHFGEEPSFSGTRGSGTIFFSGCPCRCFFCQNYQISLEGMGETLAPDQLHRAAADLAASGVHNLNLVTPDHFWPHVRELCRRLRENGLAIPILYNCSGYERPEMIPPIAEAVDIFMPDFKYAQPELAAACMAAADYPETALASLMKMVECKGFLEPFDPTRATPARTGVLVRHLVLPGHVENSFAALRRLRHEFGRMLPLSVMSQFRPMPECGRRGLLTAPLAAAEYERVCAEVEELGFEQVYLQPLLLDSGFTPDFRRDEPFDGNRGRRP